MAEAKTPPAKKAERKKPVRKAPMQKDYSTKLEWLKAMTDYETALVQSSEVSKIARLDKRIDSVKAAIVELETKRDKLVAERAALAGQTQAPAEDGTLPLEVQS